jgi:hypothetical protein
MNQATSFTNVHSDSPKLVYIMGRGHSGSSVLDAMLGNARTIESVGELTSGILRKTEICSCQKHISKCDYWANVKQTIIASGLSWQEDLGKMVSQAHIKRFFKTLFAKTNEPWVKDLKHINQKVSAAITAVSEKPIMLDSSKEFTRAVFLARFMPESKIIHLVRNPISVLASDLYRIENGTGIRFLRKNIKGKGLAPLLLLLRIISWVIGNLLGELVSLFAPARVLRVRYEDLIANPSYEFKRLESFCNIDLSYLIKAVESKQSLVVGHNIGGNQMRNEGSFVFNPRAGNKRHLPFGYQLLTRFFSWPLMLRYGYNPLATPSLAKSPPQPLKL